jgi:ribosome-associated protein
VVETGARGATERGVLRITSTCVIRLADLEWRTTATGGPGGQHANTSDTRVEVRFPVATSKSLGPRQRERLLARLGPVAKATASDSRSQARNRELALERLRRRLEEALRVERPRRETVPSRSAKQARVDAKRRRGARKQDRRRPSHDD